MIKPYNSQTIQINSSQFNNCIQFKSIVFNIDLQFTIWIQMVSALKRDHIVKLLDEKM